MKVVTTDEMRQIEQACAQMGITPDMLMEKAGQAVAEEVRRILGHCRATIGELSNPDHKHISLGKAGRSRWLGRRPHVRGTAKNPVDHPMGGGEGRTKGGRHPVSPTGKPTKGGSTRKKRKPSNKAIVRRRRSRRYGLLKL